MHMQVFLSGRLIVTESNLNWALPYWTQRRSQNAKISWKIR